MGQRPRTQTLLALLVGIAVGVFVHAAASRPHLLDAILDLVWQGHPDVTPASPKTGTYITEIRYAKRSSYSGNPTFVATFRADGTLQIEPIRDTPISGEIQDTVDFKALSSWFERIQFFQLAQRFPMPPDADQVELTAVRNGRAHTVIYSPSGGAPPGLWTTDALLNTFVSGAFERETYAPK